MSKEEINKNDGEQNKENKTKEEKETINNDSTKNKVDIPIPKSEISENIDLDKLNDDDKRKFLESLRKDMPPKDVIATLESKFMGMILSNKPSSILKDMPDEAINKMVDIFGQDSERSHNIVKLNTDLNHEQFCITSRNNIIYSLLGIGVFVFLVIFFGKTKPEYILTLFQAISLFIGGLGVGLLYLKPNNKGK